MYSKNDFTRNDYSLKSESYIKYNKSQDRQIATLHAIFCLSSFSVFFEPRVPSNLAFLPCIFIPYFDTCGEVLKFCHVFDFLFRFFIDRLESFNKRNNKELKLNFYWVTQLIKHIDLRCIISICLHMLVAKK